MPWPVRRRWPVLVWIVCTLWASGAAAQAQATVRISPPITDQFPVVSLYLSISDPTGRRIPGLPDSSFVILEDDVAVPSPSVQEVAVGTRQVFVINTNESLGIRDSRARTRLDLVRPALLDWWSLPAASLQGNDDLSLLTAEGALVTHSVSTAELASTLDHLEPPFEESGPGFNLLLQALETFSDPPPRVGMTNHVVFITPLIDLSPDRSISNVISLARQTATSVYPVLVGSLEAPDQPEAEPLRQLAEDTGGEMIVYDQEAGLGRLAERIFEQRLQYLLTYTSQVNTRGSHSLQVQVIGDGLQATSDLRQFEINVSPPEVVFIRLPSEIVRQPANTDALLPTSTELRLLITFSDDHPRSLQATRLIVDGEIVAENLEPPFDTFTWDLSLYAESAVHTLQAVAEDSLGLESATLLLPVRVEVIPPPSGFLALRPALGSLLVALAILAAGVVLAIALMNSGRLGRSPRDSRQVISPVLNRIRRASLRQPPTAEEIEAFLDPLFPEGEGEPIPLTGEDVILGRDASLASNPIDDPSVSGLHARLTRQAGGDYIIRDQGSVAGTWVNYQPVSEEGQRLLHSDLIHLGRFTFRFRLPEPPPPAKIVVRPAGRAKAPPVDSEEETIG